jgi:fatty-acyl-CoA synthase
MWANMLDVVRYRSRETPNRVALYDADFHQALTWRMLEKRADRTAAYLTEHLGLRPGDRVAVLCNNDPYLLDLFFASCETGVIVDTLNPRLYGAELATLLDAEEPRVLMCTRRFEEKSRQVLQEMESPCPCVVLDGDASGSNPCGVLDTYVGSGAFRPFRPDSEDVQMLIHTGGTTGTPKAAMLSYRYFLMNAVGLAIDWQLTTRDAGYVAMPLFHTAGWNVTFLPVLYAGGRVTITRDFSCDVLFDLVEQGHLTVFMGADALLRRIAENPRFACTDCSGVRLWCCGGTSVMQPTLDAFWAQGRRLLMGYGMTEYGTNALCMDINTPDTLNRLKPYSIGRPLAFTEAKVVREDGTEVAPDEVGELYLRGALMFSGYWRNEKATAGVMEDGWIKTGDMATRDDRGYLTIRGRIKNMYISGGENVFPIEAERCLSAYPGIKDVCVIDVPDDTWGEVGKAVLVCDPGAQVDIASVRAWLEPRLSTIKRPKYYAITDSLPVSAAGKRDLREVRRMFGAAADGRTGRDAQPEEVIA